MVKLNIILIITIVIQQFRLDFGIVSMDTYLISVMSDKIANG